MYSVGYASLCYISEVMLYCTGLEEMIRNRQHQANPNRDIGKKEKTVSLVVEWTEYLSVFIKSTLVLIKYFSVSQVLQCY